MKTYNDMELAVGINCGDTSTDSDNWLKYTQAMRREVIADAEMEIFRKADIGVFPKLLSEPLNATEYIKNNILTLPNEYSNLLELYHQTAAGVRTYLPLKDREWDRLQDGLNFSFAFDPYYFNYGERKFQLRHSITTVETFYMLAYKFPQTYDPAFDWGNAYTELEGYEEDIINGATGKLLLKVDQIDKAGVYLKLFENCLAIL